MKQIQPAQSEAHERRVIGSMVIDSEAFLTATDMLQAEHFYAATRQQLFEQIKLMGDSCDEFTLLESLSDDVALEWAQCRAVWSNHVDIEPYCEIIRAYAEIRSVVTAAMQVAARASGVIQNPTEFLSEAEATLGNAFSRCEVGVQEELLADALKCTYDEIEDRQSGAETVDRVPTGMEALDRQLGGGLRRGGMYVIAGRPGMGKSLLGFQLAMGCAKHGHALVYSFEMDRQEILERALAAHSGVSADEITGVEVMSATTWGHIALANEKLTKERSMGFVKGNEFIESVRRTARVLHRRHKNLSCIFIDYIQLMKAYGQWGENKHAETKEVSRSIKTLARELNVPIIAIAQLNRNAESRQDKRPMMSELAASGSIEADADCVMLMYRDEYYNRETGAKGLCEVNVAKVRGRKPGVLNLHFEGHVQRFSAWKGPIPKQQQESQPQHVSSSLEKAISSISKTKQRV